MYVSNTFILLEQRKENSQLCTPAH
jgi:hypothetical protein